MNRVHSSLSHESDYLTLLPKEELGLVAEETAEVEVFPTSRSTDRASNIENEDQNIQWHSPSTIPAHSLCGTNVQQQGQLFISNTNNNNNTDCSVEQQNTVGIDEQYMEEEIDAILRKNHNQINAEQADQPIEKEVSLSSGDDNDELVKLPRRKRRILSHKRIIKKRKLNVVDDQHAEYPADKLEHNSAQVLERFERGCECHDESCFLDLGADSVYKHRLNIAELTKSEHDMYLMGVTMACLSDPHKTMRDKERRRIRTQYVYQGRRVCLQAFLYLENCSHYQLKRIRKHVIVHGVAPFVHGNHGKKPHNAFTLQIYKYATGFITKYLQHQTVGGYVDGATIHLPIDVTRKTLHDAYCEYGAIDEPHIKVMSYSTFRQFLKMQFPNLKFRTSDCRNPGDQSQSRAQEIESEPQESHDDNEQQQSIQQVVLLDGAVQQTTQFLITNIPAQVTGINDATAVTYQLTNAGYVITDQGNIVTTALTYN